MASLLCIVGASFTGFFLGWFFRAEIAKAEEGRLKRDVRELKKLAGLLP